MKKILAVISGLLRPALTIGGAGLIIAFLVFLFGDNILGRVFSSGSEIKPPKPLATDTTLLPEPNATASKASENADIDRGADRDKPASQRDSPDWREVLCSSNALFVSYKILKSDPSQFRLRPNSALVPVEACSQYTGHFTTKFEMLGEGNIASDAIEFSYAYFDKSIVTCHVTGRGTKKRNLMVGTISCSTDKADLSLRAAEIELRS